MIKRDNNIRAIHGVGLILNRFYYEGDVGNQKYTFNGLWELAVASGIDVNDESCKALLMEHLISWGKSGYISIIESGDNCIIKVTNPSFDFLKMY